MKILFVSYCGANGNSLPHMAGFARELIRLEGVESVAIALPGKVLEAERAREILADQGLEAAAARGRLRLVSQLEALQGIAAGETYDILHLWTPREITRRWLQAAALAWPAPERPWPAVIIHLEDNEESLCERKFGSHHAWEVAAGDRSKPLSSAFSHPRHYRDLLSLAEGATVIWETLAEFVPLTTPAMELLPGVDLANFTPRPPDVAMCRSLGITPFTWWELASFTPVPGQSAEQGRELVVCYNGNTTFANHGDMVALYTALQTLRREGWPIRLIRTGQDNVELLEHLGFETASWVSTLGFVPRGDLPAIYSLAHLFIQPGPPDEFNNYRLPSKLPEYLASGGVCVLPAANIGQRLRDGAEALLLQTGDAAEIAARVRFFLTDPNLYELMGQRARRFAQEKFDPQRQATMLAGFYRQCLAGIRKSGPKRGGAVLATPGLAYLAGIGREISTPYTDPERELAASRAANSMLASRLREAQDHELPALRAEVRQLKEDLRQSAKLASTQGVTLGEITGSKAWRTFGKPLFKLEKKARKEK